MIVDSTGGRNTLAQFLNQERPVIETGFTLIAAAIGRTERHAQQCLYRSANNLYIRIDLISYR